MRVQFKRKDRGITVIEVVQMIQFDEKTLGLIMPDAIRFQKRDFDTYESTTKVEESDYNRWCEQLFRTGYLDLTRTDLEFRSGRS